MRSLMKYLNTSMNYVNTTNILLRKSWSWRKIWSWGIRISYRRKYCCFKKGNFRNQGKMRFDWKRKWFSRRGNFKSIQKNFFWLKTFGTYSFHKSSVLQWIWLGFQKENDFSKFNERLRHLPSNISYKNHFRK